MGKSYGAYSRFINNRFGLSIMSKMKIVRGVFIPSVKYAMETLSLKKADEKRLDVAQMRWLRRVCGVTLRDRLHNETVRAKCDDEPKLSSIIRREQLRYAGHILRMSDDRLPKKILLWKPSEGWRRPRGACPKRWWDTVKETLVSLGCVSRLNGVSFEVDEQLIESYAENRVEWRKLVDSVCPVLEGRDVETTAVMGSDNVEESKINFPVVGAAPAVPPPARPLGSALYIPSLGLHLSLCTVRKGG